MRILEGGGRDPDGFPRVFDALGRERAEALVILGDHLTFLHRGEIAEAAARNRWPTMFTSSEYCSAGGLACYSFDLRAHFKRSALFVDRILRGASPATLPIEEPATWRLVINLRTARSLGLPIPPALRIRADEVIE
jgi:putative ABC transport system substrate-binding protein